MTHSRYEEVKHTAGGEYEITRDNNQPYISETTLRGGFFVLYWVVLCLIILVMMQKAVGELCLRIIDFHRFKVYL